MPGTKAPPTPEDLKDYEVSEIDLRGE